MKKQSGFTLIELVTVIIILGILAAFAVPRFINLTSEAKAASIQGLAGSVKAASALAHSLAVIKQQTGATGSVTMEGQTVDLANGYPTAGDILAAVNISADYSSGIDGGNMYFWLAGDYPDATTAAKGNCIVEYVPSPATSSPAVVTSKAVCDS